jgi:hypothetical protein
MSVTHHRQNPLECAISCFKLISSDTWGEKTEHSEEKTYRNT